ncbi:MAG: hypothetical protein ACP5UZ_07555 [Thermoplasmata archaeon]
MLIYRSNGKKAFSLAVFSFKLFQEPFIVLVVKLKDYTSNISAIKASIFPRDVASFKIYMFRPALRAYAMDHRYHITIASIYVS